MKVLLINGSPNEKGCTYTALAEVAASLNKEGIETEIFHGADASEENVAAAAEKVKEADGLVVGAPVYWASPAGECVLFMDKLAGKAGEYLAHKPAAAVTSATVGNRVHLGCAVQVFPLLPDAHCIGL